MRTHLFVAAILTLSLFACQENFDQRLQREAEQYTLNQCPEQIEPGCILDSITYDTHQKVYTWWYQLSDDGVMIFKQNESSLRHVLVERLRNDVELKALKDKDITFSYVYRSSTQGQVVYTTNISKNDYSR